jgi:hypothetical protein
VVADGARLWVGTFDQGLASYDPDHGWRRIAGTDLRINALALEPGEAGARLWVATAEGIQVVDQAGQIVLRLGRNDGLPSRSVLSLARLRDGRIVAGTSAGAAFVSDGGVHRVGPRGLAERGIGNVWAIAETSAGLWLGTTTGLYRGPATAWTSKDGSDDGAALAESWQRLSVATGHLRDDWVTALATRGDVVWAGTYNGGVSRIGGDASRGVGPPTALPAGRGASPGGSTGGGGGGGAAGGGGGGAPRGGAGGGGAPPPWDQSSSAAAGSTPRASRGTAIACSRRRWTGS